jgi:hypothetical protein
VTDDGHREIINDPPLIVPIEELAAEVSVGTIYATLQSLFSRYARTLPPDRQHNDPAPGWAARTMDYGQLCGWTVARAHARTGDRFAIAAYLGGSGRFDEAVADFGESYADQTERDHAVFAKAVASGRMQAAPSVSTG